MADETRSDTTDAETTSLAQTAPHPWRKTAPEDAFRLQRGTVFLKAACFSEEAFRLRGRPVLRLTLWR